MSTRFLSATSKLHRTTNLPGITSYSMLVWCRLHAFTGGTMAALSYGANASAAFFAFYYTVSSGKWRMYNTSTVVAATIAPMAGHWQHLALTVAGTGANQCLGYINGRLDMTLSGVVGVGDAIISVGNNFDSEWVGASFANLEIYSRALSAAEIRARMWSPYPPRDKNLNGYYPLCGAQRTRDYSGNGYPLTSQGTFADGPEPPDVWTPRRWIIGEALTVATTSMPPMYGGLSQALLAR